MGHLSVDGAEDFLVNPDACHFLIFQPFQVQLLFRGQRTKILGKLLGVERGTHQDDLEVVSDVQQILHDGEQNVRLQVSLVNLVQDQVTHAGQQSDAQATTRRNISSCSGCSRVKYCRIKSLDEGRETHFGLIKLKTKGKERCLLTLLQQLSLNNSSSRNQNYLPD